MNFESYYFDSGFLSAVADADICGAYYELCDKHPLRPDVPIERSPAREVLKAAAGLIPLKKLGGPGTVFALGGLPDHVSLNFIVHYRSLVDADFVVPFKEAQQQGAFAILCHEVLMWRGSPVPNPPYPLPDSHSIRELLDIFCGFDPLVRKLASCASGMR
jgi:hypothetical protein